MDFNDNELTRMSKRRFLKVASAMGVSAASLRYGTQEGLAQAADEDTVPYVEVVRRTEDGDEEPIYARIARDEWEVRHTADDAAQQVGAMVAEQGWDTSLVRPAFSVDGRGGFRVVVEYKTLIRTDGTEQTPAPSVEEVEAALPDTIEGKAGQGRNKATRRVPVVVKEQHEEKTACQDLSTDYNGNVGGAQPIQCDETGDGGTTCSWFRHDTYGKGVLSSGHVYDQGLFSPGPVGNTMLYNSFDRGTVEDGNNGADIDWAFIPIEEGGGFATIDMSNGSNTGRFEEMFGMTTRTALKNDAGTSTTYYRRGRASCQISCTINQVAFDGNSFEFSQGPNRGDSGGPVFKKKGTTDEAYIGGVVVSDKEYGGGKATTAETIAENASGSFT
jgi:hypothetical protein